MDEQELHICDISITGLQHCQLHEIPDEIWVSQNWHIEKSMGKRV